jgi:septal ring factor EnvC (AmiA/AmiB activator)
MDCSEAPARSREYNMPMKFLQTALLALVVLQAGAVAEEQNPARAEADLKAVRAQIDEVRKALERDAGKRDKLSRELEESEKTIGGARGALDKLRQQRAEHTKRRAELGAARRTEATALERDREALAGQLRAAALIGDDEPLKLLLSQRDPAEAGRMLVYYRYFGAARAAQIESIRSRMREIDTLDAAVAAEEERLTALEKERQGELARLTSARDRRGRALTSLEAESKNRARELERLKGQQDGLEKLVRELRRALERIEKFPVDSKDAFAKLRGKLAWPVSGRVVATFGQTRAGGVKWDGLLLAGSQGAPVRAVYHGRIVYADWLSGLGLLTIIDHGDGYLSLYGHNERLYKEVGERVTAGDTIATVGDSGGRSRAELYFEIRKAGKPVDPKPWFKSAAP